MEYFAVAEDQLGSNGNGEPPFCHNQVIPSMFDRQYDGPMKGHAPGMPVHYDLHAYVWTDNPNGVLSAVNPNVVCPPH